MTASLGNQVRIDVPEQAFACDQPLVATMRGGYVGALHRGILTVIDASGDVLLACGDPQQRVFLRSAAKPFQVMPAILSGGVDRYGITELELAVLCASHSAEPRHTDAVLSVLRKIGLDESALRCGAHPPMHVPTAQERARRGIEPTAVCNNCSGAHTGMLVACMANGWSIDSYGSPDHPLQKETRSILGEFGGISADAIGIAVDNCHVPTFRLPVQSAALAFACLAAASVPSEELRRAGRRVVAAMTRYPEMVAGEDRFDTDLMRASGGKVVAKSGAEGFQGVGLIEQGVGIALKISDGNPRAIPPTIMQVLAHLGATPAGDLKKYARPQLWDLEGELVGELVPVFSIGEPEA